MTALEGEHEVNNNINSDSDNDSKHHCNHKNENNSTYDNNGSLPGEEMKEIINIDPKVVQFLEKHDLMDMKQQILSSKLKLNHFCDVEASDLEMLCIDLKLNSSQKIRLKHAIKSLQKKIVRQRIKQKMKSKVIKSKKKIINSSKNKRLNPIKSNVSNNNINEEKININDIHKLRSKIVIVGQAAVGKTTLQKAMMGYEFEEGSKATFSVNSIHHKQRFKYNNLQLEMDYEIFDTPGLDRFSDIITLYLRGALAVIIVYDICNKSSFIKAKWWHQYVENHASGYDKIILIANKIDISATDDGSDIIKDGRIYATEHGISFLDISAKNRENINVLLKWINKQSKKKIDNNPNILQANEIKLHEQIKKKKRNKFLDKLDNFDFNYSKCCAL
eukprot:322769_1